ncbi:MAG: ABC transporter permease subunit [Pseudolysinimonas sp.]
MRGFRVFATKEVHEIFRTWRIWVLPGILLLFAVSAPFLARYTPELVTALAGSQLDGIHLPAPTYLDAYAQWIKNLTQITLFALIIIEGGIVSSEVAAGTVILVLTKPLSRSAFVVAKAFVQSVFLAVLLALATLVNWGLTAAVFGTAPPGPVWAGAFVWLVLGVFYVATMTLLSAAIPSPAGAAGAGIAVFIGLSVAGLWKPLYDYSPAGLSARATTLAADVSTTSPFWPVIVSLAASMVLVALATAVFRRKEL